MILHYGGMGSSRDDEDTCGCVMGRACRHHQDPPDNSTEATDADVQRVFSRLAVAELDDLFAEDNVNRARSLVEQATRIHRQSSVQPTPGTNDCNDPVWLVENTSNDQMELMLETVIAEIKGPNGSSVYSDWERKFAVSVNDAYDAKALRGYNDRPLSGKQLFYLHRLYERLAVVVTAQLLAQKDLK